MHHCLRIDRIGFIRILLSCLFSITVLHHSFAKEPDSAVDDVGYQLSINDKKINLRAEHASLKMILDYIGQKMNVEMVVRIPEEEKVTIQFNDQTLEETLKLFKVNYAMITDSENKGGNIKRIVVVPEGQQAQIAMSTSGDFNEQKNRGLNKEKGAKNESFKFEFDPSKVIEQE